MKVRTEEVPPRENRCQGGSYVRQYPPDGQRFMVVISRCSSDGGWFFSVYWNVNAAGMVTQAIDGRITAHFEPLYPMAPDVQPWERRPEWAIGPEVELGLTRQGCMAQLEQQTGLEIRQEWLTEPLPTYRVPEPHDLYGNVDGADRA